MTATKTTGEILVLRHWDTNTEGHLAPVLAEFGLAPVYFDAHKRGDFPDAKHFDAVLALGAHYNVDDEDAIPPLKAEKRFIRDVVAGNLPYFGICFGSQLLASAFGAPVYRERWVEKGWVDIILTPEGALDPVLKGFSPALHQFHWHNDSFELPEKGVRLAESVTCPNQILRIGTRAYGVQFHPEVTPEVVEEWLAMAKTMPDARKAEVREEVAERYGKAKTEGQDLLRAFFRHALLR